MNDTETLTDKLIDLRHYVENLNKSAALALRNGIYKGTDPKQVFTAKHYNWVIGYQLEDGATMMKRKVFIKVEGYRFDEIPEKDKDEVLTLCADIFFDKGSGLPEVEPIAEDSILIWQLFMPGYWFERNPNIVVPGKGKLN